MRFRDIHAVVTDIEGTTSSIAFVHDVLFPYARERIPDYVRANVDMLREFFAAISQEIGQEALTPEACIHVLLGWMDEDKKITSLKTLQGRIWETGYAQGDLKGHVYADVPAKLKIWSESGVRLYVYSSGSVAAQKQIFGYSEAGDLTRYFSGYFDTATGGKKEVASYRKIAHAIGVPCAQILFLSDHPDELHAAHDAGFATIGLIRPGNSFAPEASACVRSFEEIILEQEHDSAA
jgi:enolase-phosphatase E1